VSSERVTIEQARAKLGDLVIAAIRGETTVITRYGKPAAALVPIDSECAPDMPSDGE
jgi:prevent-host-death family protein